MSTVSKQRRIEKALTKYSEVESIEHAETVLQWDQVVNMPQEGIEKRANSRADLAVLWQQKLLDIKPVIKWAKGRDHVEKGIIREFKSFFEHYEKIPLELTHEMNKLASHAMFHWEIAKKKSDFSVLKPYLEKNVELHQKLAEHLGYEEHPYDSMVNIFEFEMSTRQLDRMFSHLLPNLRRIREKVEMPDHHRLEEVGYSKRAMKRLTGELERMLNISSEAFRSDVSAHPMAWVFDTNDVRITTVFDKKDFRNSLFDSIHELGHAMYGFQLGERLKGTPAQVAVSFGFDESQSRFWENVVGHSKSFSKLIEPMVKRHLGINESWQEIYNYFNMLKTGASVRVSANELDYDFHIALRYEIEKNLVSGAVKVSELPQIWEQKMLDYVGVKPKNDREGILQDPHWLDSEAFGYFPTYTLGNVISGMIWKEIGNLDELVEQARFDIIRNWLGENIHQHGSIYTPQELLKNVFRDTYNPDSYVEYLEQKYLIRN